MRNLSSRILLENKYPGVTLGAVASEDGVLLVDCPLRVEDGREWVSQLGLLGRSRYLTLLDSHPDRILGARAFDIPIIAHEATRRTIRNLPDTFKGSSHPIGAEADRVKRVTGVSKTVPELTFSDELVLYLGEHRIRFVHQPGPTPGSIWVLIPKEKVAFIGDALTVAEPPYIGEADIKGWLQALGELRSAPLRDYTLVSARDGPVNHKAINAMSRFLRKIPIRLERLSKAEDLEGAAGTMAAQLLKGFKVPPHRLDLAWLRLQAGLTRLYRLQNPAEG